MARQPLMNPEMRRSQYLAEALQGMRNQPPPMSSGFDLGTNLLAQGLTQWGANRADERAQEAMAAEEAARRERLAPFLNMFVDGGAATEPQASPEEDMVAALLGPDPSQAQGQPQPMGGRVPTWEESAPFLAALAAEGEDIDPFRNLIRDAQPDLQVDAASGQVWNPRDAAQAGQSFSRPTAINNEIVDLSDPDSIGRRIPQIPEGFELLYDAQGNPRVAPISGYIEGQGALEGRVAGARAGATAPIEAMHDLVQVTDETGTPVWIPRSQALGGVRGQDPEIATLREGLPFAQNQLARVEQMTGVLNSEISRARNIIRNNPGVTGLIGSGTSMIPGTPAYDLSQILNTIGGNIGFNSLQELRNTSITGGGVGQLSDRELGVLSSLLGSINQGQSEDQLMATLTQVEDITGRGVSNARRHFQTTYGRVLSGQSGNGQGGAGRRRRYNPETGGFD